MISIVESLFYHSEHTPDKPALIFEEYSVSYSGLRNMIVRCARRLKKLGVREGDRIVCQCKHDPYFPAIRFAAHLCGAAFVPADKDADPVRLADLSALLDARLVIFNGKTETFSRGIGYDEFTNSLTEVSSMEGLSFPDSDSVADILFTTGTTGASKGVPLTQKNVAERALSNVREFDVLKDDVCLTMVPLNHIAPVMLLDQRISSGATMVFLDGMMKIKLMFDCIDKYGVTTVFLPPAGISLLQRLSQNKLAVYADRLRSFSTGSSAMTKSQQDYLRNMLPHSGLRCCYGSTECGVVSVLRYDEFIGDVTCCGKPCAAVDLRVVDEEFRPVSAGTAGLITIKGEMNMLGYYNRPDLNAAVFHDGYFVSNDLGYLDEEGYLHVLGRSDDMINIGGLKVFPSEIENAALRIPGVEECVCFGVPDPVTGQAAKLLIKTNGAFSGSVAIVKDELSRTMDYYKIPKCIEIVDEIAKTANGKPDRKKYRQTN